MKKSGIIFISFLLTFAANAKKVLDHSSFDDWKKVSNHCLSNDGKWTAFSVNPQEGDGILTIRNTSNGIAIEIPRGADVVFTADSRWAIAAVRPLFADTRKAKIDKKKDFDLPQDSLAIVNLSSASITRIPFVSGFKIAETGSRWLAYSSCDTAITKSIKLSDKEAGLPLVIRDLDSGDQKIIPYVKSFSFSEDGLRLAFCTSPSPKDSLFKKCVSCFHLPSGTEVLLDEGKKHYGDPVFSTDGLKLAYTASNDSNKTGTRRMQLMLADLALSNPSPEEIVLDLPSSRKTPNLHRPHAADPQLQDKLLREWSQKMAQSDADSLFVNQYSVPLFSHNGKRLVIGVAPEIAPDDTTLVSFETPDLDIWRWDAPNTPPEDKSNLEKIRKRTFPVVINLEDGIQQLIDSNPLATIDIPDRWDADWALVRDPSTEVVSRQWNYYAPEDIYVVNVNTGQRKSVASVYADTSRLSPSGKFVYWFKDGDWFAYDIAADTVANVSAAIPYPVWDETDDHPGVRQPYGEAAWSADDQRILIYDRYDIWSVDPLAPNSPVCITKNFGRDSNLQIRYKNTLGKNRRFLSNGDLMTLSLFNFKDKRNGLASLNYGHPAKPFNVLLDTLSFTQLRQALYAPSFSFVEANFAVMPNVWIAPKGVFAKAVQVSDSNPQVKDYYWGLAQLVSWHAYDGTLADGVLYLPEDLDPNKKYPMLCVFYETGSENLYNHYNMEPSWSWINYPFYVSRGYIVFVPDIHYFAGLPGESAWNFVCSGAEAMCNRFPFIDRERIGIDGQSWGGYQTAYLVTRTNMFACAGSGAPVSNMTSAFGGIRWESGNSRQGQYELGQSRIGRNLWDATELYIANSPVFHADRVHTPLLIMHNDNDGAVPWYQGIELFMALRRLQKPVWMLQYNGEAHNLKERRNRKDITIRLQQFFDHYLKGEPMPEWMKAGIPITRKGQYFAY